MKNPKIKILQDRTVMRRVLKLAEAQNDTGFFFVCHGIFEVLGILGSDYTKIEELHPELCKWITRVGKEHAYYYSFGDAWTTSDSELNSDYEKYNRWKRHEINKEILRMKGERNV